MTDDLKERLRANHLDECYEAIDRIETLTADLAAALQRELMQMQRADEAEAKLAIAVEALRKIEAADKTLETPSDYARGWNHGRFRAREIARAAIAESKGENYDG